MHIENTSDQNIRLSGLNEFFVEVLQGIIPATNLDNSPDAQNRFFIDPFQDDPDASRDWKEYAVPDLRHLFQSARDTVESDLQRLLPNADGVTFDLTVPNAHADAWLNTLNQARLAIATREVFTEEELAAAPTVSIVSRRDFLRFQIDFYAFLQAHFLEIFREP